MQPLFRCIQDSIKNYFQYYTAGATETAWGFHLSGMGQSFIEPKAPYPPSEHPGGRFFEWDKGRVLPTLQLVMIFQGGGRVEWRDRSVEVSEGQAFLLLPGEWHRYRPHAQTGWLESWFELRGEQISTWIAGNLYKERVYRIPEDKGWSLRLEQLHSMAREGPVRQPGKLAGLAMSLLAEVTQTPENKEVGGKGREQDLIHAAQSALAEGLSIQDVALRLGLSYPTLHRLFVRVLGLSPKAYTEQIRIMRAEMLLSNRSMSIKEIAAELGYYSSSHFSSCFKRSHGIAPLYWREHLERQSHIYR